MDGHGQSYAMYFGFVLADGGLGQFNATYLGFVSAEDGHGQSYAMYLGLYWLKMFMVNFILCNASWICISRGWSTSN